MYEEKPWYQSKSIIGSIVTILVLVAGALNYNIDIETQEGIIELVTVIAGVFGSIYSIYGRIKASKTIK